MDTKGFKMCVDCINKQFIDLDLNGNARYYCSFVDGIIRKGIVYDSTDASACIKGDFYQSVINPSKT